MIQPRTSRGGAIVRLGLGFAQMFGATVAVVLIVTTGINRWSMAVAVATGLCTTVSVLLFGSKPPPADKGRAPGRASH